MRQKGNNFVEYALMLALVVGIGWGILGSYGDGIPGIFDSAAELLQTGGKSDGRSRIRSRRFTTAI